MRLLNACTLRLEEFNNEAERPPYAILSHVWGKDEICLEQVAGPNALLSEGRAAGKVRGACQQAVRDSLDYVWIDTCCIDKSSSAELSEAINSMFRWYEDSEICYVFLADVSTLQDLENDRIPRPSSQFYQSRWHTRGWTLQELLAPKAVHFFSSTWQLLGTRVSLAEYLTDITLIDTAYLYGHQSLSSASIAQRMAWASKRVTTRPEDIAYCLLGIFNINMPLIYGEGLRAAFQRLQDEIIQTSNDESIYAWWRPKATSRAGNNMSPYQSFDRHVTLPQTHGSMSHLDVTFRYNMQPDAGFSLVDATTTGVDWDPHWKGFKLRSASRHISVRLDFKCASGFYFMLTIEAREDVAKDPIGRGNESIIGLVFEKAEIPRLGEHIVLNAKLLHGEEVEMHDRLRQSQRGWSFWHTLPWASMTVHDYDINVTLEKGLLSAGESTYVVNIEAIPPVPIPAEHIVFAWVFWLASATFFSYLSASSVAYF
ncbi:hypothetical protein PG984_006449 [Apiospora sp. TS-2023a]